MTGPGFDFDRDSDKPSWAGRGKTVLFFLLIAAVFGAVIYYFLPDSIFKTGKPEAAASAPAASPAPASEDAPAQAPETVTVAAREKQPGSADAEKPAPEIKSGNVPPEENAGEIPLTGDNVKAPAQETLTDEPQKGKPWAGDPAKDDAAIAAETFPAAGKTALEKLAADTRNASPEARFLAAQKLLEQPDLLTEGAPNWRECARILTGSMQKMLLSPQNGSLFKTERIVHAGDSFSKVAGRNSMTVELIKYLNHIPENRNVLRLGQNLKLLPGPWSIRIKKSQRLLILKRQDRIFGVFDVGIGRQNLTPNAELVISDRIRKPDWYTHDGRIIKYGDPANVLGPVFLKLAGQSAPNYPIRGLGIHGTQDESSVRKSLSAGCIRMHNAEAELLFLLVPRHTPVKIEN